MPAISCSRIAACEVRSWASAKSAGASCPAVTSRTNASNHRGTLWAPRTVVVYRSYLEIDPMRSPSPDIGKQLHPVVAGLRRIIPKAAAGSTRQIGWWLEEARRSEIAHCAVRDCEDVVHMRHICHLADCVSAAHDGASG